MFPVPTSVTEILTVLDKLASPSERAICRGESRPFEHLVPSVDRNVKTGVSYAQRLKEELSRIEEFRRASEHLLGALEWAHLNLENDPDVRMSVMQHFGAPTRLLDWTKSPFVATFFAAIDNLDLDGAVWWYNERGLHDAATRQWQELGMVAPEGKPFSYAAFAFREDSPEFLGPWYFRIPFARAEAQQGQFTIAGRLGSRHDELLRKLLGQDQFGKLIIPRHLKRELLAALRTRGITAVSLQHVGADRLGFTMSNELNRPSL